MKRLAQVIVFMLLISCTKRQDLLLSASDEFHMLELHKSGSEFKMLYNGFNWAEGTFRFMNDTIFVKYNSEDLNNSLARRIVIDRKTNTIKSIDGANFCAVIDINKFEKKDY